MRKSLFNFYLDDTDKQLATQKLERLMGDTTKGKLAAFLRVQIKLFIKTPDDNITQTFLDAVDSEYEVSVTKNKRSRL